MDKDKKTTKTNQQTLAVIAVSGGQHLVYEGDVLTLDQQAGEEKKKLVFDKILLFASSRETRVGTPTLADILVEGEIVKQARTPKVRIFKYRPKKRYRVKRGHRQPITLVKITKIARKGPKT